MTEPIDQKILDLTELWYRIVNLDHHKDRDCHWQITARWSYGDEPVYTVEHAGYIYERVEEEEYESFQSARIALLAHLKAALGLRVKWAQEALAPDADPEDYDDFDREDARVVLRLVEEKTGKDPKELNWE